MLVNPTIKIYNECNGITLYVEDEGAAIKVDITEEVLKVIKEIQLK